MHLRPGTLTLTQNGQVFEAYRAQVKFASVEEGPRTAEKAKFSAKGPDGESVGLAVDLLSEADDGARAGVPAAIWKVVALAATAAGD
ncbi:hypothetical protein ACFXPT_36415 [Streptomyces goshikiensis]|uniref:hypothetical protein n=1 Tax=Streptomyces goshikiensis TaxID=1942 RepID=UPI0036AB8CEE